MSVTSCEHSLYQIPHDLLKRTILGRQRTLLCAAAVSTLDHRDQFP
jgi:hypothetical protein